MRMKDFEYDGLLLSSFNMIPAGFNTDSDEAEIGNHISMSDLKVPNNDKYYALGSGYDEPFTIEFEIIKLDCKNTDFTLTDIEINRLVRWLNRKSYFKFKPIYENREFANAYYMANFNVTPLKVGQQVIGLKLEMMTNAPYAYVEQTNIVQEIKDPSETILIEDSSNEIGAKYATIKVTCNAGGDLKITNQLDPANEVIVKNCKPNEVILLYGESKISATSFPSHTTFPNDFNYNFLRIVNNLESNQNIINCSLNATVEISYTAIMKVGLIV